MSQRKILLIDDEEVTAKLISRMISTKTDYQVDPFNCPKEALNHVLTEDHDYEVILLDMVMPEVTGLEVLTELRTYYKAFELPVIMLTADNESESIISALKLGANDYITKPINLGVVIARIGTQLQIKDLHQESIGHKELETLNSMIITYNHEFNTPLAVATSCIDLELKKNDSQQLKKAQRALEKITALVKNIESIVDNGIEKEVYASDDEMIQIKKSS